jgi:perosamine synthetase
MLRYPVSQPAIGERERQLVNETIRANRLTQGPMVARFERGLAERLDVRHAIACANGTVALHLALAAMDIGPGDEVLVPDLTYVATVNAVAYTGATPVLCDIRPDSWELDLEDAARKVCDRTRAILPVHLYGQPCNMEALELFADAHGLMILEDAAEALGATARSRERDGLVPCGAAGDAGCFSFYGNKILTTGEGGAVVTDSDALATRLRHLRGQGMDPARRYFHSAIGFNYRLTDLQAAIGVGQLEALDALLIARRLVCETYRRALAPSALGWGLELLPASAAPWLFTIILPTRFDRAGVMRELEEVHRIETRPTFVPLHRLPMYGRPDAQFPIACAIGDRGLSLPTYPQMTPADARIISAALLQVLDRQAQAA